METILCDIGGVLIDVDYSRVMEGLSRECNLSEEILHKRIFESGVKDRHDAGQISSYEFYSQIQPEQTISFARFQDLWSSIFTEKREVIDYIGSLGKKRPLFTASNIDSIHFSFCYRNYKWLSIFDGLGLSYKLGCIKPSRSFFSKLCQEFSIDPGEAVLIDDTDENIKGAEDFGIKAHLFCGLSGLKGFLNDCQKQ
ncbi:MAG: HAD-IA family hydrolase [Planctomycetota bacterium]|jgi:FMN phosphatase YigB (HAD superfamily)